MKAIVFDGKGERLQEVSAPEVGPGELLLDVAYCGICGTDLHANEPTFTSGIVMGHEFSGTIAAVGSGVEGWAVGERVCVNPNGAWCGTCPRCLAGATNLCETLRKTSVGLAWHGGLAPQVSLPTRVVHRLPDSVTLEQGAWVEPTAVALRAVHRSGARLGDRVVVFGAGPIGLLVLQLLRLAGVVEVTVVEPSAQRRARAEKFGAAQVVDPTETDVAEILHGDAAPEVAFECTGVAEVSRTAVAVLKARGRLLITGFSHRPPSFEAVDLLLKEIDISSTFLYVEEFKQAIELMAQGVIDVESLTSGIVDLNEGVTAFTAMRDSSSDAVKYLIRAN